MRFRVLGPLLVRGGTRWLAVPAGQPRLVLAVLLANAGQPVSTDRLVDAIWEDRPPRQARSTVQTYVLRLRRLLGDGVLATRGRGYELLAGEDDIDAAVSERLVATARRELDAGRVHEGASQLAQALALWRGPVLADVMPCAALAAWATRLEKSRLTAEEDHLAAELALGRHEQVVDELGRLVDQSPLRERRWVLLMQALNRCGRRAEALDAFHRARRMLRDELGLDPGPELIDRQRAILAEESPPQRATVHQHAATPAQLPADVSGFTGRMSYLAQLDALLGKGNPPSSTVVIAIAGTAGIGKTALAVHWAHRVADQFGAGQLYVNLRGYATGPPVPPIQALAWFLRALGVPGQRVPSDVDEASALYRSLLAGKPMLVLLDNAADPDQVRPLLPGSPDCLAVVTSRHRLGGLVAREGAVPLTLNALTDGEARTLLTRLLGHDRIRAEPQAGADLARLCGHLPLALRIAAATLATQPLRSLTAYADELASTDRLTSLELPGDPHTAVRAAFDRSYGKLPDDVRQLFRRLGLMPGAEATAQAAGALSDTGSDAAAQLLNQLADAHLIEESAPRRYTMHDLIRLHAAERAAEEDHPADRETALDRLHGYYLSAVDAAGALIYPQVTRLPVPRDEPIRPGPRFADHTQAMAWLDAERPNLLAAIHHAAKHGPLSAAWRLADALRGYLYIRMHTVDWQVAAVAALSAAEADGNQHGQAATRLSLATLLLLRDHYRQAIDQFEPALALARDIGWSAGQAAILGNLGAAYDELGQPDRAVDHYTEASELDQRTGRLAGQAINLDNLGLVYLRLGRLDQALANFTEAMALYRQVGSRSGEARTLANLGEAYHALGRLAEAEATLTWALSLQRATGNRHVEPDTICSLAAVHRDAGRHTDALAHVEDSLTLARTNDDRRVEAEALAVRASIWHRLGDEDTAIAGYHQALDLARQIGNRHIETNTLIGLAEAHLSAGRPDLAGKNAEAAFAIATDAGYRVLADRAKVVQLAASGNGTTIHDKAATLTRTGTAPDQGPRLPPPTRPST